jgi:hypothetical protein
MTRVTGDPLALAEIDAVLAVVAEVETLGQGEIDAIRRDAACGLPGCVYGRTIALARLTLAARRQIAVMNAAVMPRDWKEYEDDGAQ